MIFVLLVIVLLLVIVIDYFLKNNHESQIEEQYTDEKEITSVSKMSNNYMESEIIIERFYIYPGNYKWICNNCETENDGKVSVCMVCNSLKNTCQ